MEDKNSLQIQPQRAAWILLVTAIVISIFTFVGKYLTLFPSAFRPATKAGQYILENYFILEFRLNTESNIIVYFTAFILLTAITLLFFWVAAYKNSVKDPFRFSWFAFAALFLILSVYVSSALPDKQIKFYYGSWTTRNGWFIFRWAATGAWLLLLAFLFRKFLLHFEAKFRTPLLTSIVVFYAGMLGVELFSGRFASFFRKETLALAAVSGIAEVMEFGGLILLLYTLLRYIETCLPDMRFSAREKNQMEGEYLQPLNPRRAAWVFVIAAFGVSILSFIGQMFRLFPDFYSINTPFEEALLDILIYQFGVNTEANIATHFATLILVTAAALLLGIAALKNKAKDRHRFSWFLLGFFVLYMSIDEQCVLHEKLNKLFADWSNFGGWLEYKWLIPALVGVGVLAVLLLPFFFHLDHKFKILFVVSAVMYFAGAFGGEMFSGRWASVYGVKNITYSAMTAFEELLEFNGVNLLIYSLLHYIEIYFGEVRLKIGGDKS